MQSREKVEDLVTVVQSYRGNFAEHVSMVCRLYKRMKGQVQQLLNLACAPIEWSVADPQSRIERMENNQKSNDKRRTEKKDTERQVTELSKAAKEEKERADALQAQLDLLMGKTAQSTRSGLEQRNVSSNQRRHLCSEC